MRVRPFPSRCEHTPLRLENAHSPGQTPQLQQVVRRFGRDLEAEPRGPPPATRRQIRLTYARNRSTNRLAMSGL
jgi:hypothetical protein